MKTNSPSTLRSQLKPSSRTRTGAVLMEYVIIAVMVAASVVAVTQYFGDTIVDQYHLASTTMIGDTGSGAGGGEGVAGGGKDEGGASGGTAEGSIDVFSVNEWEQTSKTNYELTENGWEQTSSEQETQEWGETTEENKTGDVSDEEKSWIEENVEIKGTILENDLEFLDHEGSVASGEWGSDNNKLTANGPGYATDANAGLYIGEDGLQGEVKAEGEVYVFQAEYEGNYGPAYGTAETSLGVEAGVGADVTFNPMAGDVGASAGGEAFAGGKFEASAGVQGDNGKIGANAGVTYGIGGEASADIGIEDGTVSASLDFGLTAGLGFDVGVDIEVDVVETAKDLTGWIPKTPW